MNYRTLVLAALVVAAAFALACGGDDEPATASPPAITASASAPSSSQGGDARSVGEALELEEETDTAVRGFLIATPSGHVALCETLETAFPQCGGASLGVMNLVLANVEGLRWANDAPGLFWTDAPAVLSGLVSPVFESGSRGEVRRSTAVLVVDAGSPVGSLPATGVPEVDEWIRWVLLSRSLPEDRVAYTQVACASERLGAGAPPFCADAGVPAGTTLETLPASECEGFFVPKLEVPAVTERMFGRRGSLLDFHGAFVPARHPFGDEYPTPDYAVLFLPRGEAGQQGYRALYVDDGRLVFVLSACGAQTPREEDVARWIVTPPYFVRVASCMASGSLRARLCSSHGSPDARARRCRRVRGCLALAGGSADRLCLPWSTWKEAAMLGATRLTASTAGLLAAYAGVEHGVGEIRQGLGAPGSIVFESWPDSPAFEPLGGEPAMTIIPSLAVTGVLAIVVSVAIGVWVVRFLEHRRAGATLVGLSALLLLVGGGFGPPMIGAVAGITAARIGREAPTDPAPATRALARAWPSSLIACVLGYLSLVPGVVLLSEFADFERAYLTSVLIAWSFGALTLAVVSARASDRLRAAARQSPPARDRPGGQL